MSGIKRIGWHGVHGMQDDANGDYVLHSDHEAEVARLRAEVEKIRGYEVAPLEAKVAGLRAELQNAAKAALDAVALSCEKEREADALRVDAMRYRWLRNPDQDVSLVLDKVTGYVEYHEGTQTGGYNTYEFRAGDELDKAIDAAMGAYA